MAIEMARKTVAQCLNASIGEIFFTSGGTESNNMAIKCAVRDLGVRRIITSPTEHHCVLHTVEHLKETDKITVEYLRITPGGTPDLDHLEELLAQGGEKTLVTLMHANNEIGALLDLDRASAICQAHGALLHSDTVQTVGHFRLDVQKTKVDFISGAAHKFHGPKGVGFIYINGGNQIKPFIDGGGQERNMRAGTENLSGIIGLAKALEEAYKHLDEWREQIESTRNYLVKRLQETFDDVKFNTDLGSPNLYTVLNVSFPNTPKSELLLFSLDMAGVSASGGSACSSGAEKGSHVLQAIGHDPNRKGVRFSFSHYNTKEEIDFVVEKLKGMI